MENNYEYVSIETCDGTILDGNAFLYDKNRLSEIFNDATIYFIVLENTIDDAGTKKNKLFINKDLIIWAAPREVRHSTEETYVENKEYVEISIKTIDNLIISGKVNLQIFRNLDDMLRYTSLAPFVVLINTHDNRGNFHHTLFLNKTAIIQIEGGASLDSLS
jgi:hypothetical protein